MDEQFEQKVHQQFESLIQPLREHLAQTAHTATVHEANTVQAVENYNNREAELLEQIARLEKRLGELSEQLKQQQA